MAGAPPNILVLFTDQQRADTIAAHGNPTIRTPVLDRLVREGTSFHAAYTPSPVCVAARHAFITGLPPHRTGVVDNVESAPPARSFMEVLSDAGYQTHGVGKMHFCGDPRRPWGFATRDYAEELDADDDYRRFLAAAGFDHVLDPHGIRSEFYYLPQPSQLPARLHHTTWVADRSIDFLQRRDRRRPFFLWSSFIKPHPPFETPNPWGRLYRSADMLDPLPDEPPGAHATFWSGLQNRYKYMDGGTNPHLARTQRAAYYATISFIDHHVGRILAALGDEADNTLIIFTSDHGEMLGDFGCYGKRSMLDGAVRIPLLVRYPWSFPAGGECRTPVSLLDLYPTFTAAAGAARTAPYETSRDLASLVHAAPAERIVTSQFSQRALGLYLAADGAWKYIYSAADRREWLYHVAADPHERVDRSADPAAHSALVRLRGEILGRFERDGYAWAASGGQWRDYGVTRLPETARGGLLFQDPPALAAARSNLSGYTSTQPRSPDWLSASLPAAMDPVTGRVTFSEN
jgi:arylsulfatase